MEDCCNHKSGVGALGIFLQAETLYLIGLGFIKQTSTHYNAINM